MRKFLAVSVLVTMLSTEAYCQVLGEPRDGLIEYLNSQHQSDGYITGSCVKNVQYQHGVEHVSLFVLVPLFQSGGYIVELREDPVKKQLVVSNMGSLSLARSKIVVTDNMGGLDTNMELVQAAEWIIKQPLSFAINAKTALDINVQGQCPSGS